MPPTLEGDRVRLPVRGNASGFTPQERGVHVKTRTEPCSTGCQVGGGYTLITATEARPSALMWILNSSIICLNALLFFTSP